MDLEFFNRLRSFDSTSGKEREVAEWLFETLEAAELSGRIREGAENEARSVIVDTVRALVEVEYLRQNGKSSEFQRAVLEALRRREEDAR